jgi:F-type H+-transporting ATPase subunit delta
VKAQELSRKYATAVFSLALEKWQTALETTWAKLAEDPKLLAKLQDPSSSFGEKQKALDTAIPADADRYVHNFLYTMLKDGNIGLLGDVLANLGRLVEGGPQVQVARVMTAVELDSGDKEQFRQTLRKKYGQSLEFDFGVDPNLIGGAIVQIGDKIIDGSVASRLTALGNRLGVRSTD